MKIDRILSILQYQKGSSAEQQRSPVAAAPAQAPKTINSDRDTAAVQISRDFGARSTGNISPEKLAELKAKVDSGEYKPDSRELAAVLVRDLF